MGNVVQNVSPTLRGPSVAVKRSGALSLMFLVDALHVGALGSLTRIVIIGSPGGADLLIYVLIMC
jgi:hypothetical protein